VIAAIPEEVAKAISASSRAANLFSKTETVGLVNREYTIPLDFPANLSAPSLAFGKIKVEEG
jgi:hypothetical protein